MEPFPKNRNISELPGLGTWEFNPKRQTLTWNATMHRFFGTAPDTFGGQLQDWIDLITPASKSAMIEAFKLALKGEREFNVRLEVQRSTSPLRTVIARALVIRDEKGIPSQIQGYCIEAEHPITKLTQPSDLPKEALLDLVLNHVPSMIFVKSYKNNLCFSLFNQAGYDLLGVTPEQIIGKNDYDFFPKEQADFFTQKDREVFEQKRILKIDREEINTPHGIRSLRTQKVPTYDQDGNPDLLIGISIDITEEMKAKEDLDIERLKTIQSARMASLGELAAGVAHEINNPLAVLAGHLDVLEKHRSDPDKIAEKISTMKKSVQRMIKIISGLKKFSRTHNMSEPKEVVLPTITQEALTMTEGKSIRHSTPISTHIHSDTKVFCQEIELEQVLINLINNAIDAVSNLPERWVEINLVDDPTQVVLQIRDSGKGIPTEIRDKIFQPFFTTKPVGEGTGLGLSIVKGILDQMGATIRVNPDDSNTCFEIKFKNLQSSRHAA
jgi:PAS domain S-box-containing protein